MEGRLLPLNFLHNSQHMNRTVCNNKVISLNTANALTGDNWLLLVGTSVPSFLRNEVQILLPRQQNPSEHHAL